MIIGPLLSSGFIAVGQYFLPVDGELIGVIACIFLMVILSCIGTLFLKEKAVEDTADYKATHQTL